MASNPESSLITMEKRIELEMRGRPAAQITELNLDNCRSTNIVGLTEEFSNLVKLSLINVGLTTLKGFPKLPKLKKLELSDNRISNGLAYLYEASPAITNLNLSGNRLKDVESIKPLEKFEQLEVLDLFNNEATCVDNYREKLFAMIPSLKYLDGFDLKDGEAPSEGEDDEDPNGFNGSDDEQDGGQRFNINGLEIDLDELDAFEHKVAQKRIHLGQGVAVADSGGAPDYLDEYLERLQIRSAEEKSELENTVTGIVPQDKPAPTTTTKRSTFLQLLILFMSIVSIAKLLNYSGGEDDSDDEAEGEGDDDESGSDGDGENGDVSLSEVFNEEMEDDSSDWDEDAAHEEDDDEIDDEEDEDAEDKPEVAASGKKKEESAADAPATKSAEKDNEDSDDEAQSRGKKRKHDD